jgi:hypothetical protein
VGDGVSVSEGDSSGDGVGDAFLRFDLLSVSEMELAKLSLILAKQLALEWVSVASWSVSDVWLKSQHQQLRTRSPESEAIS